MKKLLNISSSFTIALNISRFFAIWKLRSSPLLKLKKATVAITATATIAIRLFSNHLQSIFISVT